MDPLMNRSDILNIISKNPEYLLVSEVYGLMPGQEIKATRNIEFNDPLAIANDGIVPTGTFVDMFLQTISICVLSMPENVGRKLELEEIKKMTIYDNVGSGIVVKIEGNILRIRRDSVVAKAIALVENKKISEINFTLKISDVEKKVGPDAEKITEDSTENVDIE